MIVEIHILQGVNPAVPAASIKLRTSDGIG